MKSLFLFAALCLPLGQLDQKGNNFKQYDPVITSVQTVMSYEPGQVSIFGRHFDLVTGVKLDGLAVRVVRNTGNEIVIRPDNMDPGFSTLELLRSGPSVKGTIEFAPSLRAARVGDALSVTVNPLEPGMICLYWSSRSLMTDIPGVYFPRMIDLSAPMSGLIYQGVSHTGEAVAEMVPVPYLMAMFGTLEYRRGINLQAYCVLGDDAFQCHTNMVRVAPTLVREDTFLQ